MKEMKKQDAQKAVDDVLRELRALGVPQPIVERRVNWSAVSRQLMSGVQPQTVAGGLAAGIGTSERFEDSADERHDAAHQHLVARSGSLELKKCDWWLAGVVGAGEHMNIKAKKYYWFRRYRRRTTATLRLKPILRYRRRRTED